MGAPGRFGIIALLFTVFGMGGPSVIPPVTLLLVAFQVCVFLRVSPKFPDIMHAALIPSRVLFNGEFSRLFWCAVTHADDIHLYFNMASLLVKGFQLEQRYGHKKYFMLVTLLTLSSTFLLLVFHVCFAILLKENNILNNATVGFSGALFALKVVIAWDSPGGNESFFNLFTVPVKYSFWAELLICHFLVPNSSFLGHLSGIIAGLMFCVTRSIQRCISKVCQSLYHYWMEQTQQEWQPAVRILTSEEAEDYERRRQQILAAAEKRARKYYR